MTMTFWTYIGYIYISIVIYWTRYILDGIVWTLPCSTIIFHPIWFGFIGVLTMFVVFHNLHGYQCPPMSVVVLGNCKMHQVADRSTTMDDWTWNWSYCLCTLCLDVQINSLDIQDFLATMERVEFDAEQKVQVVFCKLLMPKRHTARICSSCCSVWRFQFGNPIGKNEHIMVGSLQWCIGWCKFERLN